MTTIIGIIFIIIGAGLVVTDTAQECKTTVMYEPRAQKLDIVNPEIVLPADSRFKVLYAKTKGASRYSTFVDQTGWPYHASQKTRIVGVGGSKGKSIVLFYCDDYQANDLMYPPPNYLNIPDIRGGYEFPIPSIFKEPFKIPVGKSIGFRSEDSDDTSVILYIAEVY